MLKEEDIKEFQQIYKRQFGKEISSKEALEQGTKLVSLMKILLDYQVKNSETGENNEKNKSIYR